MMEKFFKRRLSNGITVIMEKRNLPLVAFSITNKFGAAYEESGIKGAAHFIEHMLFTGTEKRTHEDISREIEKKGGVLNAFTTHELTSYWFKLPSEHLFSGMDIIIDMLKNSKFDERKFERERRVILEEIKMYHDDPRLNVSEQIEKNLFENPFGELIIGNKETIGKMRRDFLFDYFKKVYSPENYIVTIVGDADFEEVCSYFDKSFSAEDKKVEIKKIKKKNKDSFEERAGIDQAHLIFAFHAPLMGSKEYHALEVMDSYLASGMSSRLFLKIREEKGLAYAVKSSINAEKNYSYYGVYVGTRKDAVEEVKKAILDELNGLKNMTENDLKEAKERAIGLKKVSSEESVGVMNELVFNELAGNAEDYYDYENKIRKVALEDVKKFADIKDYSFAVIVPK